jgi:hypothetical protein
MKISYDSNYKDRIITQAGLTTGADSYLVDKKSKLPVKDINGDLMKHGQFSGLRKGSVDFIKSDLASLIKLSKKLKK